MSTALASVVVNNHNYGRFLRDSIDSALAQDYPATEIVVVDDGSTDDSVSLIREYGDAVVAVVKANGGQASAFNAGFAACSGEVVVFLDADDRLHSEAVREAVLRLNSGASTKVHWPLALIDASGESMEGQIPEHPLPAGDLQSALLAQGPLSLVSSPTSGNAWSRRFLERVLPMPESEYRLLADCYLLDLAPLFGRIERIDVPMTDYRVHGSNGFWHSFDAQLWRHAVLPQRHVELVERYCGILGIRADSVGWQIDPWWSSLQDAATTIVEHVPVGAAFLLIDDDLWGMDSLQGRSALPFPAPGGAYAGPPAEESRAIEEVDRRMREGVSAVVLACSSFWWLDTYPRFVEHLERRFERRVDDECLKIWVSDAARRSHTPRA